MNLWWPYLQRVFRQWGVWTYPPASILFLA
jgi:hypothetical protein